MLGGRKCCKAVPRCRSCPVLLWRDVREAAGIAGRPAMPPHLADVPACLHKYEPLLRQAWERRDDAAGAAAQA